MSFHQHSRICPINALFFMHIPGYSQPAPFRSFVFSNIPGYPFIFDITFLFYCSLQTKLITDLISITWFFMKALCISPIPR